MQKNITVMILNPNPGEAVKLGADLVSVAPEGVEIQSHGHETAESLAESLKQNPADCVLLYLGAGFDNDPDLLNRYARQTGGPATIVVADNVGLDRELEWVHRGIQDVVNTGRPAGELVRCIMMALERRHLLNDAQQALRLEQENVHKMQQFVDELVGYATRTATMGH